VPGSDVHVSRVYLPPPAAASPLVAAAATDGLALFATPQGGLLAVSLPEGQLLASAALREGLAGEGRAAGPEQQWRNHLPPVASLTASADGRCALRCGPC
jgi:hypothetical protein